MSYFKFYVDDVLQFYIQLVSRQCEGTTKQHSQCRRKTVIGTPYCRTHCKTFKHVEVKTSLIPNAGLGLFAFDKEKDRNDEPVFRKGETVLSYDGQEISIDQLRARYQEYTGPYVLKKNRNTYIDPAGDRSLASLANQGRSTGEHRNNARFTQSLKIQATRPIYHGDEILVSYGNQYQMYNRHVRYVTDRRKPNRGEIEELEDVHDDQM